MPATHKLYDVLGVQRDASKDEIKRAYKKYAVQHHPDKGGDEEKFKEVANAYGVLSDEEQRRRYDALGDDGFQQSAGGGPDPHDIFQQFFGGGFGGFGGDPFAGMFGGGRGGGPRPRRCNDHQHAISITLAEAFRGLTKTMRITVQKPCTHCKATCYTCQGVGQVTQMIRNGPFIQTMMKACETCKGKGVTTKGCDKCAHKGSRQEEHRIEIVLPPGVEAGHRTVIAGMGEQPLRDGDVVGDLVVDVMVGADRTFRREGADLHMTVPISFIDSVVGTSFVVPHFAGDFTVDAHETWGVVQPNVPYKIAKKGMPRGNASFGGNGASSGNASFGDLVITFAVKYPAAKLAPEARKAMREALAGAGL